MKKLLLITLALLAVAATVSAEITYPVDVVNTRWAIIDTNSGEIIYRNKTWPVGDGGPISSMPTNIVYLLHFTDHAPAYDSRVFTLNSTETVDVPDNQLRKTYAAVRRPTEELLIAAENVEATQASTLLKLEREVIQTRLAVGAIIKFALKNQTFPAKVQTLMDQYEVKAVKVWNNRDRLKALKAVIEAGGDFDLDAGWEPTDNE